MARSTRSAFSSNSVPSIGFILSSTSMQWSAFTRPSSPENCWVITEKSRGTPSSWLDEVRYLSGQSGQVSPLSGWSGGRGRISSWVTDSAPWRLDVPIQSEPVSPPPMTTTCLPPATIGSTLPSGSSATAAILLRQELHGEVDAVEVAAGDGQVARLFGAGGEHDRVVTDDQLVDVELDADVNVAVEGYALRLHLLRPGARPGSSPS